MHFFPGFNAFDPTITENDFNLFTKTFERLIEAMEMYGSVSYTEDTKNIAGNNIQRISKIKLDYSPEIIDISYHLERLDGQWHVCFNSYCGDRRFEFERKSVSIVDNVINDIDRVFCSFMDEIYFEKHKL